jgi:hypothetical protein
MSKVEVGDKAMELMKPHLGEKPVKEVIDKVIMIDHLPAVGDILKLIAR